MLTSLLRGLTSAKPRPAALFDAATAEARRPIWYLVGAVPDTLDGRFAVLATVCALILVRLEREGSAGNRVAIELTERFIEVMESEHRELGLGDPSLGKTVRKLVAILARRTELWRSALAGSRPWPEAVRESLYRDEPDVGAAKCSAEALKQFAERLETTALGSIEQGTWR